VWGKQTYNFSCNRGRFQNFPEGKGRGNDANALSGIEGEKEGDGARSEKKKTHGGRKSMIMRTLDKVQRTAVLKEEKKGGNRK